MPQATRPTSFNPDGQPNRTPVGYDLNHANPATWYPVFLDPNLDQQPDPRTFWTLGRFGALHPQGHRIKIGGPGRMANSTFGGKLNLCGTSSYLFTMVVVALVVDNKYNVYV